MDNSSKRFELVFLVIALLITILLYSQVARFNFVWDDPTLISENPNIQGNLSLRSIFLKGLWDVSQNDSSNPPFYRPLVTLAYALEYRLFELNAGMYHLVNLVFHLLNGVLIWLFCRRLKIPSVANIIAVSLFLVHPAQVHCVCFISCHGDILALFFSLLSMVIWTSESNKRYFALFFIFAALLCKEVAIFLPLLCVLYDLIFKRSTLKDYITYVPLLCWIPCFVLRHIALHYGSGYSALSPNFWTSPGSFRVFLLLGRILAPIPNPPDIRVPLLTSFAYCLFHLAIICLAYISISRTKNNPTVRFFLVWFLASILLVADYPNIGMRFSDQFLYYPIVAAIIIFALLVPKNKKTLTIVACAACVFIGLTAHQIPTWKNEIRLWGNAIKFDPTNPVYAFDYADALRKAGKTNESCKTLQYTLKLLEVTFEPTTYKSTAHNFANCVLDSNPALAEKLYVSVIKLDDRFIPSIHNLSIAYMNQKKFNEALANTQQLIQVKPNRSDSWHLLGIVYSKLKEKKKADDAFQKSKEFSNSNG